MCAAGALVFGCLCSGASDSILAAQEEFSQEFQGLEEVLEQERLLHLYELPEGASLAAETDALKRSIATADAARAALHDWALAMVSSKGTP